MKTATIKIARGESENNNPVSAFVTKHFGIHKTPREALYYTVTHLKTGHGIHAFFRSQEQAIQFAKELESQEWADDFGNQETPEGCRKYARLVGLLIDQYKGRADHA